MHESVGSPGPDRRALYYRNGTHPRRRGQPCRCGTRCGSRQAATRRTSACSIQRPGHRMERGTSVLDQDGAGVAPYAPFSYAAPCLSDLTPRGRVLEDVLTTDYGGKEAATPHWPMAAAASWWSWAGQAARKDPEEMVKSAVGTPRCESSPSTGWQDDGQARANDKGKWRELESASQTVC